MIQTRPSRVGLKLASVNNSDAGRTICRAKKTVKRVCQCGCGELIPAHWIGCAFFYSIELGHNPQPVLEYMGVRKSR